MADGLIRVNFSARGFAKVFPSTDGLSPFTPDPQALVTFGLFLGNQQFPSSPPTTFVSIPDFRGIDYVGYVIEKERLDQSNGNWERLDEFKIIGSQANSFKDSRIAYGEVYRYRIRSVMKFTTTGPVDNASIAQTAAALLSQVQDQISSNLQKNQPLIATAAVQGLQPKTSAGVQNNSVDLGNGTNLTIDSNNLPTVTITIPNPAAQATSTALQGSLSDIQGALASGNVSSTDLTNLTIRLQQNGITLTQQPQGYISEYFEGPASKNWQYINVLNQTLPPPPSSLRIVPSSPNQTITVYWLAPADIQRDLASFNIYRRNKVGDPFEKIASDLNLDAAMFVDENVQFGQEYIYAISTVDLHGYESFLSSQVMAQLNSQFKFEQVEKPLAFISGPGVRPDENETILKAFYPVTEQIICHKNIRIAASRTYAGTNDTLLLRIRSLDTHEVNEVVVKLANKNV